MQGWLEQHASSTDTPYPMPLLLPLPLPHPHTLFSFFFFCLFPCSYNNQGFVRFLPAPSPEAHMELFY